MPGIGGTYPHGKDDHIGGLGPEGMEVGGAHPSGLTAQLDTTDMSRSTVEFLLLGVNLRYAELSERTLKSSEVAPSRVRVTVVFEREVVDLNVTEFLETSTLTSLSFQEMAMRASDSGISYIPAWSIGTTSDDPACPSTMWNLDV